MYVSIYMYICIANASFVFLYYIHMQFFDICKIYGYAWYIFTYSHLYDYSWHVGTLRECAK